MSFNILLLFYVIGCGVHLWVSIGDVYKSYHAQFKINKKKRPGELSNRYFICLIITPIWPIVALSFVMAGLSYLSYSKENQNENT